AFSTVRAGAPSCLTAFPGGPIRYPDSAAPTTRSNANHTDGPRGVKVTKSLVASDFRRSRRLRILSDNSRGVGFPRPARRRELVAVHAHHRVADPPTLLERAVAKRRLLDESA